MCALSICISIKVAKGMFSMSSIFDILNARIVVTMWLIGLKIFRRLLTPARCLGLCGAMPR